MCLARCLKRFSVGASDPTAESVDCASVVAVGVAELADSPSCASAVDDPAPAPG